MKAKLENGRLVKATNPFHYNGKMYSNPTDEMLADVGFKEVVDVAQPYEEPVYETKVVGTDEEGNELTEQVEVAPDHYYASHWEEESDRIVKVWERVTITDEAYE